MTEQEHYSKLFQEIFDPKNRGFFKTSEVETLLIANGYLEEKQGILELLSYLEADSEGRIRTEDVKDLMEPDFVRFDEENNLADVFGLFDKDEDQQISVEDLKTYAAELGYPLTDKQAALMIKAYDSDRDSKISLEDFISIFKK